MSKCLLSSVVCSISLGLLTPFSSFGANPCVEFDFSTEQELMKLEPGSSKDTLTAYSDDHSRLVVANEAGVVAYDIQSGKKQKLSLKNSYLAGGSPDGKKWVLINDKKAKIVVWDVEKNKTSEFPLNDKDAFAGAKISADGKTLIHKLSNGDVREIELATGKEIIKKAASEETFDVAVPARSGSTKQTMSPDQKSVVVHTSEGIRLVDTATGITHSLAYGGPGTSDVSFYDNKRLLVQTGTQIKLIKPEFSCADHNRQVSREECSSCSSNHGSSPEDALKPFRELKKSALCSADYDPKDWETENPIPATGAIPRDSAVKMLMQLQKPGAFVPEEHLPILMAIFDSDLPKKEPDHTAQALAGIFTTHPRVYERLMQLYPVLSELKPQGMKACRSEKEESRVKAALDQSVRTANLELAANSQNRFTVPNLFVTVGSAQKAHQTRAWADKKCRLFYDAVQVVSKDVSDVACASENLDPNLARTVENNRNSGKYKFRVGLYENKDGTSSFQVTDWTDKNADQLLSQKLNLSLQNPKTQITETQAVQKLVKKIGDYNANSRSLKELALLAGISASKRLTVDPKTGEYFDKQTSKTVSLDEAYRIFETEDPRQKHYLRAAGEVALLLGSAMVDYYYFSAEANQADWQFRFKEAMKKKLLSTQGMRFDDNRGSVNIGHSLAGTGYYLPCRTNNLSSSESFMCAIMASYFWELIGEYREVWSINDMIVTPVGGLAIGEPLYQLGRFFNRGGNTVTNKLLSSAFGGTEKVNNWLNNIRPKSATDQDEFGFPTDVWHQFKLSAGYGHQSTSDQPGKHPAYGVGLDTEIINHPTFDKEGTSTDLFKDTMESKLRAKMTFSDGAMRDLDIMTKAVLAGYYKQNTKLDEKNRLNGYTFFVGPSVGVDLRQQNIGSQAKDMVATVNVLGSTVDVTAYNKGVRSRLTLDVYGDFAMVHSYAIDDYVKDNGREGLPSVLKLNDYYYATGVTAKAEASVSYKDLELSAEFKKQYLNGINGSDRYQEQVTKPIAKNDELTSGKLGLAYRLTDHIRVKTSAELLDRKSNLDKYSKGVKTKRYLGELEFLF